MVYEHVVEVNLDEKGVSHYFSRELEAVVIAGSIIVPLLTIMTRTFTRTASQGEETQAIYFDQEVMEIIRSKGYFDGAPTDITVLIHIGV